MDGPANTWNYFYAGYAVIFFVMGVYLVSLMVRRRNLLQDIKALKEIKSE
jgi:hypothetical protein